jgi:hypothetical protein
VLPASVRWSLNGELWCWRGPSPYHFITVPGRASVEIRAMSSLVSYGWGVIPVRARVGRTTFMTSLFPKDGACVLPIKDAVRKAEQLDDGDTVTVELSITLDSVHP